MMTIPETHRTHAGGTVARPTRSVSTDHLCRGTRGAIRAGLLLGAALFATTAVVAGQNAPVPGPSFEDVISLRFVGTPRISPDGRAIAFQTGSTDWERNRYHDEIWLAREDEEPFQLTRSEEGSRSPRWSPNGRWIGFLSDRGEKTQVYVIRADGGEALQATWSDEGVNDFRWSPDGLAIAYTAADPQTEALKQREERYGEFSIEDGDHRFTHLWAVDFRPDAADATTSGDSDGARGRPEPRRLTEGESFTVDNFDWSPDGSRIAYSRRPDPGITSFAGISIVDVATLEARQPIERPGSDRFAGWSPDGRWVLAAWTGEDTLSHYYRNGELWKVPVSGDEPVRLGAGIDEWINVASWTPQGIFALVWDRTRRGIVIIDPETGRHSPFADEPGYIGSVDFSADGESMALLAQDGTTLGEIYRTPVRRYEPVAVTAMTRQIDGWPIGTREVVSWQSEDGTTIEGVLDKPPGYDPSRRYPLIVIVHGGPTGIDIPIPIIGGVYPAPQWLAKGALVLRPNYRGSAGYGEAFRALNVRNLGVGDMWDVVSGVDHLIHLGMVDSTRMGVMGWSQGGYISAFLATNTDRFAAISVGAGISNWMTYYANTDIPPFTRQYLKATPWADPEIYALTSPMTNINDARTPTLIQHGENDRRVPIANAYELYRGLRDVGVETELIVFRGFGHGINRPKERLAALWQNWQWFARYLWDEEVELPLETPVVADDDGDAR